MFLCKCLCLQFLVWHGAGLSPPFHSCSQLCSLGMTVSQEPLLYHKPQHKSTCSLTQRYILGTDFEHRTIDNLFVWLSPQVYHFPRHYCASMCLSICPYRSIDLRHRPTWLLMTTLLDSVWPLIVWQHIVYLSCHPGKSGLATMIFVHTGQGSEVLRAITEQQLLEKGGISVQKQNVP